MHSPPFGPLMYSRRQGAHSLSSAIARTLDEPQVRLTNVPYPPRATMAELESHPTPPHRDVRLLSVVAPMHDEEATVELLYARVRDAPDGVRFELVLGVREQRAGESWFKLATARWFYKLFSRVTKLDLPQNAGDFRLLDRSALDAILSMRERNRFLRGMTTWVGGRQIAVHYHRDARHAGETKYTFSRMVRFSLDAMTSFSWLPLQAATLLGFVFSI